MVAQGDVRMLSFELKPFMDLIGDRMSLTFTLEEEIEIRIQVFLVDPYSGAV